MNDAVGETLLRSESGGILTLQFNRPRARNAINRVLRARLRDELQSASVDPDVRVVIIRGDARAFCAGGDIKQMGNGRVDSSIKLTLAAQIIEAIANMPKPVIAAVQGHAAGAGFSLAMACDLIVADGTADFSSPFAKRGLVPDMSATFWLLRQVGLHRAKDILLTARALSAREALDLGIVSRLWTTDEFETELLALAESLVSMRGVALGLSKQLLNRSFESDLSAALAHEHVAQLVASEPSRDSSPS